MTSRKPAAGRGATARNASDYAGFFAPFGTPREIVVRLNVEMTKLLMQPDMKERPRRN